MRLPAVEVLQTAIYTTVRLAFIDVSSTLFRELMIITFVVVLVGITVLWVAYFQSVPPK